MTLDEAISHALEVAERYERMEDSHDDKLKEECLQCAAEHRQLAKWLTELKEAKRLLKLAVEDFKEINSDILTCKYCKWHSTETDECTYYPDDTPCEKICGWKHEGEALKLLEKDDNNDEP